MVEEKKETIFHKILKGDIKSEKVYEDDYVYAFKDVYPVAPFHVLVIPKLNHEIESLLKVDSQHEVILGKLMVAVSKIAKENNLEKGYRTIINTGEGGGQTVFYLHIHIIAGRELTWPPG